MVAYEYLGHVIVDGMYEKVLNLNLEKIFNPLSTFPTYGNGIVHHEVGL